MIIEQAIKVLKIEAQGILDLIDRINDNFTQMVELICKTEGRVVISGIGKSGIIGQKIVSTLNSTGSRSFFLHPVEAMHGDLGMVSRKDVFLALSNSGETEEINILIPSIRKIGCKIIAFTGKADSTLAQQSDLFIDVGVNKEACPLGLAPTSSTTAVLAMGDALAVALIYKKDFKTSDFRKFHPGGNLGQRLSANVGDIMLSGESVPCVFPDNPMNNTLEIIDKYKLGVTLVALKNDILKGIITDGDLRRFITKKQTVANSVAEDVMTENPRSVTVETPVYDALNTMAQYQITALPVTDPDGKIKGILHLHDILGKGAFKFNGS